MKLKKRSKSIKSFNELLDKKYGRVGTKKRDKFEEESKVFVISESQKLPQMIQKHLADKIDFMKSYISRIENGKADIQLSTLFKIFEQGLGRRILLEIK